MGTPNRELQDYSRNILEYTDTGRYIPIMFLLYSWGSLFGVPIKVPLPRFFGVVGLVQYDFWTTRLVLKPSSGHSPSRVDRV